MLFDVDKFVEFIRIKRECASYEQKVREKYENDYRNYIEGNETEKHFYRTQVSLDEVAIKTIEFYKEGLKVAFRNSNDTFLLLEYIKPSISENWRDGDRPKRYLHVLGSDEDFEKSESRIANNILDITPYIGYPDFYNSFPEVINQIEDIIINMAEEQRIGFIELEGLKNKIIEGLDKREEKQSR